uniref:(northern house mosquito) hypothetical protein n=1 Tax=Culex pipiens TaxID=7175 RepID=A0A8D8J132_CULPI
MATPVTRAKTTRNHHKTRPRRPPQTRKHRAREDPTVAAVVAKVTAVAHPEVPLRVVAAHQAVPTVGVRSPVLPTIRHRILLDRTIPSSRTSCRSVVKPATWTPCEHMLTQRPVVSACWDLHRAILVIIRDMDLHRDITADRRATIRIRTNRCTSKRWTSIRIRNHPRRCTT